MNRLWIIRDERIWCSLRECLGANWKSASDSGNCLAIEISSEKAKRSSQQNRRYWALIDQIAEQAWVHGRKWDREVWHEAARRRFLPQEDLPGGGTSPVSTTSLKTKPFNDYMQEVEAWAVTELGVQFMEVAV